jgi:hypothetical protein
MGWTTTGCRINDESCAAERVHFVSGMCGRRRAGENGPKHWKKNGGQKKKNKIGKATLKVIIIDNCFVKLNRNQSAN